MSKAFRDSYNLVIKNKKEIFPEQKILTESEELLEKTVDFLNRRSYILGERKLSYQDREDLPDSVFALPKERKYPIIDANHAKNALARASRELERGNLTKAQYDKIVSKAHEFLKEKD